jgi:hypothetical protein
MSTSPETATLFPEQDFDVNYWYVSKEKTKRYLRWSIIVIILLLLAAAILVPSYSDYSSVARIGHLRSEMRDIKLIVTEQLEKNPQAEINPMIIDLLPEVPFTEGGIPMRISYKTVTRDGTIIVVSDQAGALITLHPELKGKLVEWSCQVSSLRSNKLNEMGSCSIHTLTSED